MSSCLGGDCATTHFIVPETTFQKLKTLYMHQVQVFLCLYFSRPIFSRIPTPCERATRTRCWVSLKLELWRRICLPHVQQTHFENISRRLKDHSQGVVTDQAIMVRVSIATGYSEEKNPGSVTVAGRPIVAAGLGPSTAAWRLPLRLRPAGPGSDIILRVGRRIHSRCPATSTPVLHQVGSGGRAGPACVRGVRPPSD